jgi:hypothetical protein
VIIGALAAACLAFIALCVAYGCRCALRAWLDQRLRRDDGRPAGSESMARMRARGGHAESMLAQLSEILALPELEPPRTLISEP